ncbi:hypothetical protein LSH36_872g01001 [Paralvinella palmiformis]|uniref:X-box-binding protein 1 n=1 Tax=Paralvinella palmiformis TaxID=53620 RepID=A0AAD9IY98_9ANNE|nr:hypothetical protein LSH36_872g01001 [Paralvinella palmiformis]
MESSSYRSAIIKTEPKDDYDSLMLCSSSISPNYTDLWTDQLELPKADIDMYADVVEKENIIDLDVITQPSLPSPDRNSEFGDSSAMDSYLSPGQEDNMIKFNFDALNRVDSVGGSSDSSSDICLGAVSFNDLLDPDYKVPGGDLIDVLSEQLKDLNDENEGAGSTDVPVTSAESSVQSRPEHKYCLRERKHTPGDGMTPSHTVTNMVERRQNDVHSSKTIILNRKDGSSKVLNLVPVIQGQENRADQFKVTSAITSESHSCMKPTKCVQNTALAYLDTADIPEDKSRKNALQAKINREKKKAYITSLEKQVAELSKDNGRLQGRTSKLQKERDLLSEEVTYLRSVIANQSTLSKLLGNITDVKSLSLTTSFSAEKRSFAEDHNYGQSSVKRPKSSAPISGGVCLHVENENVSLEFCSSCARMARGAARSNAS